MSNKVTIVNGADVLDIINASLLKNIPPDVPLNMEGLEILFESMQALSSPPTEGVEEGDVYLDDGTNTESGQKGFRQYASGEWVDFGLQEIGDIAIDGGEWT